MINRMLSWLARFLLWLRYRITVTGLDEIRRRGNSSVLFLPNHPALIDPVILCTLLYPRFRIRPLASEGAVDRFFIRRVVRRLRFFPIPDMARAGSLGTERARRAMADMVEALKDGDNLLLYPAGTIKRTHYETCRGNAAVYQVLQEFPEVRVVLVRTKGLWGSSFSFAAGTAPPLPAIIKRAVAYLAANAGIFMPRRRVSVEFFEPDDFPRQGSREEINAYLEGFYNAVPESNTFVPYAWWQGKTRALPEPETLSDTPDVSQVPASSREMLLEYLRSLTGISAIDETQNLAKDLGIDSLAKVELFTWLEKQFGTMQVDTEAMQTVADVMLAAAGEAASSTRPELQPLPRAWFKTRTDGVCSIEPGTYPITHGFLLKARKHPSAPILADPYRGVLSYKRLILGIFVLKRYIERLNTENIGIMLPASTAASTLYMAVLFSGKTPVMFNWTVGRRAFAHNVSTTGVQTIFTSKTMQETLAKQGIDLSDCGASFVNLEDVVAEVPRRTKALQWFKSRLWWRELWQTIPPENAVILFTSGSETLPKAVPLTQANLLTNIQDITRMMALPESERLTGILPPFHSFGLLGTVILPLLIKMPTAYYPVPTDGAAIADIIAHYRTTALIGTPTFLNTVVRSAGENQLASLRLVVTGAEKCTQRIYDRITAKCPDLTLLEGYGITECSPVVAVNPEDAPKRFSIGKVMPSVTHALVHPENYTPVAEGEGGVLLLRGPSVFNGYYGGATESPFVDYNGYSWYATGDIVAEDKDGYLFFRGRVKRFVKLGGEMISLPAIESVLRPHFETEDDDGPTFAVEATDAPDAYPEIVLFTVKPADRENVNTIIQDANLSPLHNIRRIIELDEMPVMGTGKTDYKQLREKLKSESA